MKTIYIVSYWSESDNRPYVYKAYKNRKTAKEVRDSLNANWEDLGRIYRVESIDFDEQ